METTLSIMLTGKTLKSELVCPWQYLLNSCMYFSAAAYSQQGDHEKAVNDAKKAIEVDPKYSKAYSRMG